VFLSGAVGPSTERAVAGPALLATGMSDPEPPRSPPKPPRPEKPSTANSVAFTIDVGTGHVDKIEVVERDGVRRELNGEERAELVKGGGPTLEAIFAQTFIAGIDSVLGDGAGDEVEETESEAEKALVRELLQPMIQRSAAGRLLRPEVLRHAVLRALVQDAATSAPSEGGPDRKVRRRASRSRAQPSLGAKP
jgi:hypothetical protein